MDYEKFLLGKYNKVSLTKEELSTELNLSVRFISDMVRAYTSETDQKRTIMHNAIPNFIRSGSTPLFPIREVANFLEKRLIEVA